MKHLRIDSRPGRKQKGRKNSVKHMIANFSITDNYTFFTTCNQARQIVDGAYSRDWNEVTCPQCLKRRN